MQPKPSFDPADAGTPEAAWRSLFRLRKDRCAQWRPPPGALLVVAPHPDDEILGAGGLLHTWAMSGEKAMVLSVTDGEAADPGRVALRLVRRAELREALRTLSPVHVEVHRLSLPDGELLRPQNRERLRCALRERIREPTTLIAPYERDGHPDHEAVGEVCLEVARAAGRTIARYPVWTWHHTDPGALAKIRWGVFRLEANAHRAKLRALRCFKSQLQPPRGEPIVPPHVLAHFERPYEAFVI